MGVRWGRTRQVGVALVVLLAAGAEVFALGDSENLAPRATITESQRHSDAYRGQFTANDRIPAAGSRDDVGQAWCLPQAQAAGAILVYRWPESVTIGQIIYYGRTSFLWDENFLEIEVYTDPEQPPVFAAELKPGHGPQPLILEQRVRTRSLTLRFPRADTGPNPGASEIQIFATPREPEQLARFRSPSDPPYIDSCPQLAARVAAGQLGFDRLLLIQRQALRPSHVYTYHNEDFRPGGGLYRWDRETGLKQLVHSPDGQLLDLAVSYDGREVLFSWRRRRQDTYQIYRMNVDGTERVALTKGEAYNFNPCWLPDGGIAFLSTRARAYAYCWDSPVGVLYRMDRDGGNVVRLSANYLNDFTPNVLNDGRIIYSRWEYVDRPAIPIQSLWTIQPDGTGLQVYYGNRVLSPATFMEARSIPGSDKVLCLLTAHNGPARGGVGILDRRHGANAQQAICNLTPEVAIGRVDRGDGNQVRGPYENPFPLDSRYFLVAYDGTILVRDYEGTEQAVLQPPQDGLGFYNPQPIRATAVPPVVGSLSGDAACGPAGPWASIYLQDVYRGLEPHVARGEIVAIRVVEEIAKPVEIHPNLRAFGFQFPVVSSGATYAPKRVWGEVPVRQDGSAAFLAPAGRPLYFLALDAEGRALQRMRSFTHFMSGETQTCIGCHEQRSSAPPITTLPAAFSQSPRPLDPPEWGRDGFSYARIVQPVLNRNCLHCHNTRNPQGNVDLSADKTDFFNVSYETLVRQGTPAEDPLCGGARQADFQNPFTSWISTYNGSETNILEIAPRTWGSPASPLADLILAGHPDKDGKPRIELTHSDQRRVFAWIDLNVPYYGTSDSNHRDRRGCRQMWPEQFETVFQEVTARRCARCHTSKDSNQVSIPRKWYLRVERPQMNRFLLAPLARTAGGTQECGHAVFSSSEDPDYQAIMATFRPLQELLKQTPRMDLEGDRLAY